MTRRRLLIAITVLAGALLASDVFAQGASCTISATSVNFGSYNVFDGAARRLDWHDDLQVQWRSEQHQRSR